MEQCSLLLVQHFGECSLFVPVRQHYWIWLFLHMTILDLNNLISDGSLTAQFVPRCRNGVSFLCSSYLLHHTTSLENACTRIVQSDTLAGIDQSKRVKYCKWQIALKKMIQAPKSPSLAWIMIPKNATILVPCSWSNNQICHDISSINILIIVSPTKSMSKTDCSSFLLLICDVLSSYACNILSVDRSTQVGLCSSPLCEPV
jgi:hypothetical protein